MKIRVEMTVEVDPNEWADQYGVEPDAGTIRQDVRAYVQHLAFESPAPIQNVTLKRIPR